EYYDEAFKRIKINKDEVIVIGDSLTSDIKGALDYGIACIWFNKNKKDIKSNATYEVDDLLKIKEIL
nr:HAD hydrolase-like protein [Acholeplasmatales bacterium]